MTQEELTKLLMESYKRGQSDLIKSCHETISIAVHTAILAEREACAKVCDDRVTAYQYATDVWAQEHIDEARHLAKAIRARGQE